MTVDLSDYIVDAVTYPLKALGTDRYVRMGLIVRGLVKRYVGPVEVAVVLKTNLIHGDIHQFAAIMQATVQTISGYWIPQYITFEDGGVWPVWANRRRRRLRHHD